MSQDGEGEELPGQRGLHQRQPGRHRHQGQGEPRLRGQIRELFLFLELQDSARSAGLAGWVPQQVQIRRTKSSDSEN